ncbi:uncharacterized protein LOC131637939 [Vicia villosa]|uniref:uncharacterized protein LOC131637939 n=1 Tax=Vicia villosa TaxID=3911 RepID=UPI00273AA4DE|nr:uncharacterized protein LOC131637939 [Vicia villosa]
MAAMEAARLENDEGAASRFFETQREYNKILIQKEIFWKQRAKIHWLRHGELNSKFFHMSTTVRKNFKRLDMLVDETGAVARDQEGLCRIANSYFKELFEAKQGEYDPLLNCIQPVITHDDNHKLLSQITKVELTYVSSLYNVVYELVAKLLANRLKLVLDKCVSKEQSAFIEGRSILDNTMGATKIIHALKRKTNGNMANLALKIDIIKAYGRVDWGFLRGILLRLSFDERWTYWLLMCVTSVHYSVLVNSDRVIPIILGRGMGQGDPLSPVHPCL